MEEGRRYFAVRVGQWDGHEVGKNFQSHERSQDWAYGQE